MAQTQPQTKVIETIPVKGLTADKLVKTLGRPLGSPINGKEVGQTFPATLTGKIEIREFNGAKGAYFTTKEGYSIRVNASFNPSLHVEGKVMNCICRSMPREGGGEVKFTAFVD